VHAEGGKLLFLEMFKDTANLRILAKGVYLYLKGALHGHIDLKGPL
jgi:hypothetical protein